jgi:DNA invertase Pin-like site-specific DNA recombinase
VSSEAEFERGTILERQREDIAEAEEAGKYQARKSTMPEAQVRAIRNRLAWGENKSAPAREFGVSRQTIYNIRAAWGRFAEIRQAHSARRKEGSPCA